jgi:methylenetetrahydrofolate dehydrogenase (NADP+) / methenyltetrahydrofolate cyclohydrolase
LSSLILDGKAVRDRVFEDLQARVRTSGRKPGLAVILVGDDPASRVYVSSKGKACEKIGFHHVTHALAADTDQQTVLKLIDDLNRDSAIHGILVQIPLPGHLSETAVQQAISPLKDVDGLHPMSLGGIVANSPGLLPCTPKGVLRICEHYEIPLAGREIAIVGRSVIVGRPLAMMLSRIQPAPTPRSPCVIPAPGIWPT